jgi:Domain of unknown function (DUF5615)
VKILLDENMPESLVEALKHLGHRVDSVNHLKLKGLDNGTLYRQIAIMTFVLPGMLVLPTMFRQMRDPSTVKVLRVVVPQQRTESVVPALSMLFKTPTGRATPMATIGRVSS